MYSVQRMMALAVILTALCAVSACGGDANPTAPTSGSIPVIVPDGMFPGESAQATALVVLLIGASGSPAWLSSNPGVATITPGGKVTAVAPGTTRLTVTYQGASGAGVMTVYNKDTDLLGISIQGCPERLDVGQLSVCRAVASVRGGVSTDVGLKAEWSSTNPFVARSEGFGRIQARSVGQTVLSAVYQGKTASLSISITGGQDDMLNVSSFGQLQGVMRAGSTATWLLQGFYSVVSGPTGGLSVQVSDQSGVFATTSTTTVAQGGDTFALRSEFTIPLTSTRVCMSVILAVGATVISAPTNGFCLPAP
jgi:hypothetical protein